MLAGGRAEALSLTPTSTTCTSTSNLGLGEIYALLSQCFGVSIPEQEFKRLYKSEQGGGEEGAWAPSYNTSYFNVLQDPSAATINYTAGGDPIICAECYMVVK